MAESYVPSKWLREVRALIRHRASIVKIRTMVKNKVHALIDRYGYKCEYSDLFGKAGIEWLEKLELNPLDRLMLSNHLQHKGLGLTPCTRLLNDFLTSLSASLNDTEQMTDIKFMASP